LLSLGGLRWEKLERYGRFSGFKNVEDVHGRGFKFEVFLLWIFFANTVVHALSLIRVAQHLRKANAGGLTQANTARVD
jgi:hypothetical protein